jgi:hypothetical protein
MVAAATLAAAFSATLLPGGAVAQDSASTAAEAPATGVRRDPVGWQFRRAPQADLWYHALAVVQADQPGPLGLYSAEYARRIREVKQQRGIYPTMLDSLASEIRRGFDQESSLTTLHFVPLYFPDATPERMLGALWAVARRQANDTAAVGRDVSTGVAQLSFALERRGARRVLETLVSAVRHEWKVFYKAYWDEQATEDEARIAASQAMWDSTLLPYLGQFLERRRLSGGIVMPSRALGPEGRIVDFDAFDPTDQVVAVQVPFNAAGPDATVFAFLKELCFLIVDRRVIASPAQTPAEVEDLTRTAAVRCGALILDFYAPTRAARYRRAFLDAVGAEESFTVAAFERVYALEPSVYERLREQVRRR